VLKRVTCEICGGEFYSHRKDSKCCSDSCKREYRKVYQSNYREGVFCGTPEKAPDVTRKPSNLAEINRLAREAGMSYGRYVAMMKQKEER
jgi:hypothetical protein